jgi:hypothetical protein
VPSERCSIEVQSINIVDGRVVSSDVVLVPRTVLHRIFCCMWNVSCVRNSSLAQLMLTRMITRKTCDLCIA